MGRLSQAPGLGGVRCTGEILVQLRVFVCPKGGQKGVVQLGRMVLGDNVWYIWYQPVLYIARPSTLGRLDPGKLRNH